MELEREREEFEQRGLKLAALSYDSVELLAEFAERKGIGFPLLSDPESLIIRRADLLSPDYPEGNSRHGLPHPATFVIDETGVVRERYLEESYRERRTLSSILVLSGEEAKAATSHRDATHFELTTAASSDRIYPGQRVTLSARLRLAEGFHAYAPGEHSYRALELKLDPDPLLQFGETRRPEPRSFYFEPLDETVLVHEGDVRLLQDVLLVTGRETNERAATGEALRIAGVLRYQLCSAKVCYPPAELPVVWELQLDPPIRERSPEPLRR